MAKVETVRLNVNLPKTLIESVDAYADSMNINRTSAVAVLLSQSLNAQQAMADISKLASVIEQNPRGKIEPSV